MPVILMCIIRVVTENKIGHHFRYNILNLSNYIFVHHEFSIFMPAPEYMFSTYNSPGIHLLFGPDSRQSSHPALCHHH